MRPLTSNKWVKFENIDNPECWQACGATEILLHCQRKIQNGTATLENKLAISHRDFPDSSVGKESACNSGDPGLIPGLERAPGEGNGYPLQYSCASPVAQLIKNLPAMWETWVRPLGWEDPLWEATHSSVPAWRIPWTVQSMRSQRVRHNWVTFTFSHRLCTAVGWEMASVWKQNKNYRPWYKLLKETNRKMC